MIELDPEAWFALLAQHAPELRKAGVRRLRLSPTECVIDLARFEPEPVREPSDVEDTFEADPLKDRATYGLHGGRLPGFRRPHEDDDSD